MTEFTLEKYWELVEHQLQQLAQALASGDAVAVELLSGGLQQLATDLHSLLVSGSAVAASAQEVRTRIRDLSAQLPAMREVLYRRNAHVDMALQTLVPTAAPFATYAAKGQRQGASVYGGIPRKSGTFQVASA